MPGFGDGILLRSSIYFEVLNSVTIGNLRYIIRDLRIRVSNKSSCFLVVCDMCANILHRRTRGHRMVQERRRQRSQNPIEAAELYLAATAKKRDFKALTLSNPNGDIVAKAPTQLDPNALAALAPIAGPGDHLTDGLVNLVTRGSPFQVWNLEIEGQSHFLSAVGLDGRLPNGAEEHLKRILC